MALLALLIGVILVVSTIRNTHGQLLSAVRQDVPDFAIWGAAIFGVAAIGFIPGLKPVSRGLLALIILVIVLTNFKQILGSFEGAAYGAKIQAASGTPTQVDNGNILEAVYNLMGQSNAVGNPDYTPYVSSDVETPQLNTYAGQRASYLASLFAEANAPAPPAVAPDEAMLAAKMAARSAIVAPPSAPSASSAPVSYGYPEGPNEWGLYTQQSAQWQKDTFVSEAASLKERVAAGQIDPNSTAYATQLDYLAGLRGGVATYDAGMSELRAMGL